MSPTHKLSDVLLLIVTEGKGVTKILIVSCSEPQVLLAVKVYVPAADTEMEVAEEPVLHE